MSESFLERLSRFTPDAGKLERDALLFAAGRRSARPNRGWIALAAALAGTQALSLALLALHPMPPASGLPGPAASVPPSPTRSEPATPQAAAGAGLWTARQRLLESEADDHPSPVNTVTLIQSDPPLRAFGPPPPSILN
jgi:hypothetical protein